MFILPPKSPEIDKIGRLKRKISRAYCFFYLEDLY